MPQEEAQIIQKNRTAATNLAIILTALVFSYLRAIMVGTAALPSRIAVRTARKFRKGCTEGTEK